MEGSRNRKQRRAAAAAAAKQPDAFDPASIPLAHPPPASASSSSSAATGQKTLVDIIAERQGALLGQLASTPSGNAGTQFVTVDPRTGQISAVDEASLSTETKTKAIKRAEKARRKQQQQEQRGKGDAGVGDKDLSGEDEDEDEDEDDEEEEEEEEEEELEHPIPPVIDTLLLAVPLTTLHLTLAYLAAHQYAQEIELEKLVRESAFVAFPMLALLIHLAHGHIVSFLGVTNSKQETVSLLPWDSEKLSWAFMRRLLFPPSLRTLVFLPLTGFLGCKLMLMTNEDPYYAVMKHAPAFGTMWIWGVLEMSFGPAVLGALGPLIWGVWWMGYGII
ncbi:uncharacterized protein BO97DRAFT_404176 [Aspergillus homomorphus CBS 101889]|uniref:DUF7719 domain-containing protein n=1 Tax=Aspergillus homomorphus (strain CBS 101889) TaxID=1450537 RepID=A0A395I3V4_ASPHC|nr:hypothetical protein BO97DRAFT_404176 [Aspergillus homomorphus CBS 101889]RAL14647.1 hypothetical protein BO97DRAFT_404176 [Aspergillus homomorphus CBS 101889]